MCRMPDFEGLPSSLVQPRGALTDGKRVTVPGVTCALGFAASESTPMSCATSQVVYIEGNVTLNGSSGCGTLMVKGDLSPWWFQMVWSHLGEW